MKIRVLLLISLLLIACPAGAAETIEGPASCQQCGMSRTTYARSRMLVIYADGTTSGFCSLHCAVEEMGQTPGKKVESLQVADYQTKQLIDARSANWVIGGTIPGGMNSPAKWAFANKADALKFVEENGGRLASFDQAMEEAKKELANQDAMPGGHHMGHDMSHMNPGSQMVFNPAFGDDIYHTHPAGMWMVSYKYMRMDQNGLRHGTTDIPAEAVTPVGSQPYGYMMAPTRMTMDMHMVMVMYGLTDRFTLMAMGSYLETKMDMVMNMGMGNKPTPSMTTNGPGDTELRGAYNLTGSLVGSLGLSLPTGDTEQEVTMMGRTFRAPYDMQLGSGTYDLKPALTYSSLSEDALWNWGGQAAYTFHTAKHNGYKLGDNLKVNGWLQRALGPAAGWLRLAYSYTGHIQGQDSEIEKLLVPMMGAPTPDADPSNYGGKRLDGFVGASVAVGSLSLGVEGGIPLYQDVNGLQMKNDWYLTAGIQGMF